MLKQMRELLELDAKQFHEVELSRDEFHEWNTNPTTEKVMQLIFNYRALIKEQLARGETLGDNSVQDTAQAVGIVTGLDFLLTMEYDEEVKDERGEDDDSSSDA